jgi:hypothetical protein
MERVTDEEFKVRASGQYYTLDRHILVRPDHVKVEDTIRNNTPQDLGVLIWNRFDLGPQKFEEHFLAGYKTTGRSQGQASPSVFVGRKEVWSVMNRGEAVSRQQARPGQGQATSSRERL